MSKINVLGFSRDHSGSMRSIAHAAMKDFNDQLATIQAASLQENQQTFVSTVTIGEGSRATVGVEVVNQNVNELHPLTTYRADAGGTPMIESVFKLIELLKASPHAANEEASFLVMVTTDGQETHSKHRGPELARVIRELQATDRWTFVFRVPKGGTRELDSYGIHGVNVFEWDQTARGVQVSTQANTEAFTEYFKGRSAGMRSTTKFYANLENVSIAEVKTALTDISAAVKFWPVEAADDQVLIRPFVEAKLNGDPMVRGGAFYQLVKTEPRVQANKRIAIRDKTSGAVYAGDAARQMLALPTVGTVRLAPHELGNFEVFIQSTSVNRKLDAGTKLMYWEGVGKSFKEGPSAR